MAATSQFVNLFRGIGTTLGLIPAGANADLTLTATGTGDINLNSPVNNSATVDGSEAGFTTRNLSNTAGSGVSFGSFTTGNVADGDAALNLGVHETGTHAAEFDIVVKGDSGNTTPGTHFIFPGLFIVETLPTSDPHVVNALYTAAGVVKVSAG